jgi:sugar O-acyltransferase (sialic acid O-acetyltransferase NeuD family)
VNGKKVLVFGAGGQGRVVMDALATDPDISPAGFLDDAPSLANATVNGLPVLGGFAEFERLVAEKRINGAAIGIGYTAMKLRRKLFERILAAGAEPVSAIHKSAYVSPHASFDSGVLVGAFAALAPNVMVHSLAVIYNGCTVDHDCVIGENAYLSPGVHLAGGVCVEKDAFLGIGVSVVKNVSIGAGAVVGAGAAVLGNVEPGATVAGVPAKPIG